MTSPNGVLPVDKPVGPTSHDVVAIARRALGTRRIGHTGTLDPFASGLLLLCLGPATRLAEYLVGLPKSYQATMRLGVATETDDLEGTATSVTDAWRDVTREAVVNALARMAGDQLQTPPQYSAKKVGGERMYAAARAGRQIEARPAAVHVSRIEMTRFELPEVDFEVDCSSGTYIRSIARDVGEALGVGAHLTKLRRTRIGAHDVRSAVPVDALDHRERVAAATLSPADALSHLPAIELSPEEQRLVGHGRAVERAAGSAAGTVALLGGERELLAIGSADSGIIRPVKVFT